MKIPHSELEFYIIHNDLNLSFFVCKDSDYEEFLKEDALNDQNDGFSVTRIALYQGKPVGYFTLMTDIIEKRELPRRQQPPYEYREYPALKIARLATHKDFERRGIGRAMLMRAYAIAIRLSKHIGCRFITVDATSESIGFYKSFDFQEAKSEPTPTGSIPMYIDFMKPLLDGNKSLADFEN